MAPIGTLWGVSRQPQTKIICSVAALNGLELEQPEWKWTDKPAGYTSAFSYGKIPAFEGSDGFKLMEGATIARYLCGLGTKVNLLGSDAKEIAQVDQWSHFSEQEIGVPGSNILGVIYGFAGPFNREALDKQTERLVRALTYVETYLGTRPSGYLVSDSLTLADLFLVGGIYGCCYTTLGAAERAKYPAIFAHYAKVTGNKELKQFWGTEKFTDVAVTEPKSFQHS
ncbi:glutathione S-transferase C-terminal-like protein [Boletus edulis]|uniref:Glutathione S-transferase C-terminal-like protein n=1 Tax=Boletus edulis BED1 TaxID=1328754 RepID=A0AAD4BJY7_BOLED|nr:glutathione S-transferase C-terminal-like protein [Boletus edulis]KAF8432708.1 glutathione S-transferase C-terminal-like protein [Boletus edulis BED1]